MTPTRLRQLEAFHVVMQTGSVTRTAELLRISQPAVSKHLKALEAETRLALFDRANRRLLPTPEARRLHGDVAGLFRAATRVELAASEIRSAGSGELRIAALPMLGLQFLPRLLPGLVAQCPGLRLSVSMASSQQVMGIVMAERADVGFLLPRDRPPPVRRRWALTIPACAVLPPDHRHAGRASLTPDDFADEPFISLGREDRSRLLVDELFERHGVRRQLRVETQNAMVACEMVAGGLGVTLVDAVTASNYRGRAAVLRLAPALPFHVDVVTPAMGAGSCLVEQLMALVAAAAGEVMQVVST